MGLLCDCKQYFGSDDLYVILGVNKDSNQTQRARTANYHLKYIPIGLKTSAKKWPKERFRHSIKFIIY